MKKILSVLSILTIIMPIIVSTSNLFGQQTKVKEKNLSTEVTKTFHMTYPDAKIIGTAKEVGKGITYFEIESKDGKVRRDLLYTKAGEVAEIEEVLTAETIPAFVKDSIEKKFIKVKFKNGEKNISGPITIYEVVIVANEVKYEVVCDSKGKITKTTKLKSEKSDK